MPLQPRSLTALSFSSSGVLMVGQMGIYCKLLESGLLKNVKELYGCSGGSLCAYMAALGVTPSWIREWVQHFDTRPIMNIQEELVVDYATSWGVDSCLAAKEYIGKFIDTWEPGASQWTFADLHRERPGISLYITATNVSTGKQVVFSHDSHPSMLIADAIHASSSIPFYATPFIDPSGHYLCDGAIIETLPYQIVRSPATTLFIVCSPTATTPVISSLGDYIHRVLRIMRFGNLGSEKPAPTHLIRVNPCGIMLLNFMISKEERLHLFASGLSDGAEWIMRNFPGGTEETPPCSGDLHTSVSSHPSQEPLSDSHQSNIPLPFRAPFLDLPLAGPQRSRRWSC